MDIDGMTECSFSGAGYTLWQVRGPDESGDITKAYNSDAELYGRDVRKVRALKQIEGMEELQNLRTAMEGTDPDGVRESRSVDRLPLTSWADSSGRVLLMGDGATSKSYIVSHFSLTCMFVLHNTNNIIGFWHCLVVVARGSYIP
jgi:hypothetical protein